MILSLIFYKFYTQLTIIQMQFSEEYKQMEVLATERKAALEKLCDEYDAMYEHDNKKELKKIETEMENVKNQYTDLRQKMEREESRMTIEYWNTYRGEVAKIEVKNGDVEQFLKKYRANFKGKKDEKEDEKLLSILENVLENDEKFSDMSKYTLNLIKEDFEDVDEDIEYFSELREKIEKYF